MANRGRCSSHADVRRLFSCNDFCGVIFLSVFYLYIGKAAFSTEDKEASGGGGGGGGGGGSYFRLVGCKTGRFDRTPYYDKLPQCPLSHEAVFVRTDLQLPTPSSPASRSQTISAAAII